jgi:glycosyltransferase involved in cell wall biosynthesis
VEGTVPTLKRVCFYSIATHLGGAERSVLELARGLRARRELGYEPWFLLPKPEGPLIDRLREEGISYDVLALPRSFFTMSRAAPLAAFHKGLSSIPCMGLYLRSLVKLVAVRKPDVIHTNAIKCHALAGLVGPATGVPVLWHLRDMFTAGGTLWALHVLRRVANVRVTANSRATADSFSYRDEAVQVIHNGLDPSIYVRKPNRIFSSALGVSDDTPIVGILGVIARWKGQDLFLNMAKRLIEQGTKARFVVIGAEIYDTRGQDRGLKQALQDEAHALGIAERVLFAGFRENVEAINGLDVLVHASIRPEPFGRVILEAMACGVPVVAAAAGGVLELVDDGENGLLFAPGNIGEMAHAVSRLLDSKPLMGAISQSARARFLARFTAEQHEQEIARIYDEIIDEACK